MIRHTVLPLLTEARSMKIRTHYWHTRVVSPLRISLLEWVGCDPSRYFRIGNAGDIFTEDVVRSVYGATPVNAGPGLPRLLIVGSIGDRVQSKDIVCGIGVKTRHIVRPKGEGPLVLGVRGPITYDVLKSAGFDVSRSAFQLDPGLLVRYFCEDATSISPIAGKVGFIPHYRERTLVKRKDLRGLEFIDIDARPCEVARKIAACELIYSSSLHGVIFSHSLGRPCVLVRPSTDEALLKFQDYYASVNLPFPTPLGDISERHLSRKPISPVSIDVSMSSFSFPPKDVLIERSVAW